MTLFLQTLIGLGLFFATGWLSYLAGWYDAQAAINRERQA